VRPKRKIVRIDEEKCTGCGQCIPACVEGAIAIIDGKARLVRDSYCDGLGACLGECPEGAITIEERDAEPFDEAAAKRRIATREPARAPCPGSAAREIRSSAGPEHTDAAASGVSELQHWPVQLALVPPDAPYLQGADLLLVADCVPFAMADFHVRFLRGRCVVVGCPKLDDPDRHVAKLADILRCSSVRSLTVIHMVVPCCYGLVQIARKALAAAGGAIPARTVTVGLEGKVAGNEGLDPKA